MDHVQISWSCAPSWSANFKKRQVKSPKIYAQVTRSMHTAMRDLSLDSVDVVHAGSETFPLGQRIRAVAASRILDDL